MTELEKLEQRLKEAEIKIEEILVENTKLKELIRHITVILLD